MVETSKRVITPEARLSFPALFEPQTTPQGKKKYSACLIFEKTADMAAMKKAALLAASEKWGDKAPDMIKQGKVRLPFRDGNDYADKRGFGPEVVFMNVGSDAEKNAPPGIVDRFKDPKTGKARVISDPAEVYPGCYVRASLSAFAYDTNGNKGVSFGLNNIQKLRDGERLDGRSAATDDFEALEDSAADMEDGELDDMIGSFGAAA